VAHAGVGGIDREGGTALTDCMVCGWPCPALNLEDATGDSVASPRTCSRECGRLLYMTIAQREAAARVEAGYAGREEARRRIERG